MRAGSPCRLGTCNVSTPCVSAHRGPCTACDVACSDSTIKTQEARQCNDSSSCSLWTTECQITGGACVLPKLDTCHLKSSHPVREGQHGHATATLTDQSVAAHASGHQGGRLSARTPRMVNATDSPRTQTGQQEQSCYACPSAHLYRSLSASLAWYSCGNFSFTCQGM